MFAGATSIIAGTLPIAPVAYAVPAGTGQRRTTTRTPCMTPLFVLAALLLLAWGWALWERHRHARFMAPWIHVPLLGGLMSLVMAIGLAISQAVR